MTPYARLQDCDPGRLTRHDLEAYTADAIFWYGDMAAAARLLPEIIRRNVSGEPTVPPRAK